MADALPTIDLAALELVTGGRYTAGPETIDPLLVEGVSQLARVVSEVGQNLAAVKQQSESQKMQMLQQVMQQRAGAG